MPTSLPRVIETACKPRRLLWTAAVVALLALVSSNGSLPPIWAQAPGWSLQQVTPGDAGVTGGRWLDLAQPDRGLAFTHDGDISAAPGGPTNPDGSRETFVAEPAVRQLTSLARGNDTAAPSVGRAADAVAFETTGDPTGGNPDGSREVFAWTPGGIAQLTDATSGGSDGSDLSSDGAWAAFWHSGDLTGANPDGSVELFLAQIGGPTRQLTDLSGTPYHSLPSVSEDGRHVAFVLEADLTGDNPDLSWELFLWTGPATTPGDPGTFRQLTQWAPPMTGRELYDPSVSDAGERVVFAGRGHVDASQPGSHTTHEVYLWDASTGIRRLTTATARNRSSNMPRISGDGTHVVFVSLSDLDPSGPGNANGNAELFMWSACRPVDQITDSTGRPSVITTSPEVRPAVEAQGIGAALISETPSDVGPLVLTSRRGIVFLSVEDPPTPCDAPGPLPTLTPAPTATPTPTETPDPGATPPTAVPPPTPSHDGRVCPQMLEKIPPPVQAYALANPQRIYGWFLPRNPSLPPGYQNPMRRWLSLRDPGKPYSWTNPAVWKAGCP